MLIQVNYFKKVWELVKSRGYELVNADCTIIAQKPKMAPHIEQMKNRISQLLETTPDMYQCQSDND